MRRVLKWIGIVLGVLIVLLVVAVTAFYAMGTSRLNRSYDIQAEAITIPTDDDSLARGAYLVTTVCTECHGSNLGGERFIDEPGIVTVYAPNITPGEGGISDLSDEDLIRAIRHGIDQDDSHLIVMPAEIFIHMSEEDLGSVIAFLRTLSPVDNAVPEIETSVMARVLLGADQFGNIFPAEYINHDQPFPEMPEIGVNEAYGEYLVAAYGCTLCHGENLAGGITPINAPPGEWPLSPNLTGDNLADWTEDNFVAALRGREMPGGSSINGEFMPIELYARLSDVDLKAIWAYLQTVPAAESAVE